MTNQSEQHVREPPCSKICSDLENDTEARDVFRLAQARNRALSQDTAQSRKKEVYCLTLRCLNRQLYYWWHSSFSKKPQYL